MRKIRVKLVSKFDLDWVKVKFAKFSHQTFLALKFLNLVDLQKEWNDRQERVVYKREIQRKFDKNLVIFKFLGHLNSCLQLDSVMKIRRLMSLSLKSFQEEGTSLFKIPNQPSIIIKFHHKPIFVTSIICWNNFKISSLLNLLKTNLSNIYLIFLCLSKTLYQNVFNVRRQCL